MVSADEFRPQPRRWLGGAQEDRYNCCLCSTAFWGAGVKNPDTPPGRRALPRRRIAAFFANLPPRLIGMQACATAHYRAREPRWAEVYLSSVDWAVQRSQVTHRLAEANPRIRSDGRFSTDPSASLTLEFTAARDEFPPGRR